MQQTMKAVRIHSYGGPEVLMYEDAPMPQVGPGDALVKVHAAGVNPVDWKVREGHLAKMHPAKFPLILGWDVSGVVESVGAEVKGFKVGDEVFSRPDITRDGTYAEYVAVGQSLLALKPRSIDHVHAAAIPLATMTAWQVLFDAGGLKAGQKVLIHAGAGGVGSSAIQLAKWKGAHVIATASTRNVDFVRSLGADEVVDYMTTRFEEVVHKMDMVFDTLGGDVQESSWKVLAKGGLLVSIVSPPSQETADVYGVRQKFVFLEPSGVTLRQIAELVDAGRLKVTVDTVLPLTEARQAQELSAAGHTRGKIVLRVV